MKFCELCGSRLIADTLHGKLSFVCERCLRRTDSTPDDTLRSHIDYQADRGGEKFNVMESNAAVDTAGLKIEKKCPKCFMPYLTHIYVGHMHVSKYVCECGMNMLSRDYVD